ncbi:MAG: 5'-3' exonuclease [Puniceicoccales bacterium]|jgi:DNA polymerase-1|nr:5'-3' exonuclease [Puniceicoccales bacterium]
MADLLLLDGHNIIFRAFYGVKPLSRKDGFPVSAIYGWVKTVWRLQDLVRPQKTFAFFDRGKSAARLEIYPEYKANRAPTPEDLRKQIPPILEISKAMGIGVVIEENVEADDLLASYAIQRAEARASVAVASADKDFAQIIGGSIVQWVPMVTPLKSDWQPMNGERVMEKWGIPPGAMVDFLSLVGDAADNIRGVRRVGVKTAGKLLGQYGSIDGILAHADELPAQIRNQLHQDEDLLRRNQRLIRFNLSAEPLILEVPVRRDDDFYKLLLEYELPSLMQAAMERDSSASQALLTWTEE